MPEQAGKRKLQRPTASKQINATEILQKQKHQQQQEQQQQRGAGKGLTCAKVRESKREIEQPRGQNNGAGSGNKNGAQVQPRGTWHVSPKSLKCLFG